MAKADSPTKTCGEDGCGRPLRARGLCSTHYNQQHQPNRHAKVTVPCAWCRTPCVKDKGRCDRYTNLFCSLACRDAWRRRQSDMRKLPVLFTGTVVRPEPGRPMPKQRAPRLFVAGTCARCGTAYLAEDYSGTARYCSLRCARRVNKQRYRARKKQAYVADVSPARIYERDGWRCQLCRKKVRRDKAVPHPLAPVLDHIVPLACGGTHEPANVQCAHFICNSKKSDGASYSEQLMLVG